MTRFRATVFFAALAVPAACTGDPSQPDSGTDAALCQAAAFDPAASLWGETCPATYEASLAIQIACPVTTWTHLRYDRCPADGLLRMTKSWGTHGYLCFYDGTSRQLVGAGMFDDVTTFCNHSSSVTFAGRANHCVDAQLQSERLLCAAVDGSVQD